MPELTITTPLLWQGSLSEPKQAHSIILQASGKGRVLVEAFDEQQQKLHAFTLDIQDVADDDSIPIHSLNQQYERQFPIRYTGLQLRFTITSDEGGLLRLVGFAITTRN